MKILKDKIKCWSRGFSLIEIMVAVGLMSVVSLGVMQLTQNSSQSFKSMEQRSEELQLINEIRTFMSIPSNCKTNLELMDPNVETDLLVLKRGSDDRYKAESSYGGITINTISFGSSDSKEVSEIAGSTFVKAPLTLELTRNIMGKETTMKKKIPIAVTLKDDIVESCAGYTSQGCPVGTVSTGKEIDEDGNEVPICERIEDVVEVIVSLRICQNEIELMKEGLRSKPTSACDDKPLYSAKHTESNCIAASGELVDDPDSYFCRFNAASCPSGWDPYKNWTETQETIKSYNPKRGGGCRSRTFSSGYHTWADMAKESVERRSYTDHNHIFNECLNKVSPKKRAIATIVKIGCY